MQDRRTWVSIARIGSAAFAALGTVLVLNAASLGMGGVAAATTADPGVG